MTWRLFLRNLRHHGVLFAAVAAGLAGFEALLIRAAAAFEAGPGLRILLELVPPSMRSAVEEQLPFVTFAGTVGFGFQHPFALAAAIAFIVTAATIPAAEAESGFLGLVLARPLARRRYLAATLALVVLAALVLPLAQLLGAAAALPFVEAPGKLPWQRYLPAALLLAALLLAIGGLALLAASGAKRRGRPIAWVVGYTLAAFVVDALAGLWKPLHRLDRLTPFHYFNPVPAAVTPHIDPIDPIVLLAVFAAATALAFLRFARRDA